MFHEIEAYWAAIKDPSAFPNSCEGDLGTPSRPSIWLMGIEPGRSRADQAHESNGATVPGQDRYSVEYQIGRNWRFNINAFKFLAVFNGEPLDNWESFARRKRVFEGGSSGYLKGNINPEQFADVATWNTEAALRTGCSSKAEYYARVAEASFENARQWIEKSRPKLIIGTGTSFRNQFLDIVGGEDLGEAHKWKSGNSDRNKTLYFTKSGVVPLAVIPHLSGQGASVLKYDDDGIAHAANFVRQAMQQNPSK